MKVLIVDDEPLVRRSLSRVFAKADHEVTLAEDGAEGLNKWIQDRPDLVLLDVLMPGLSGPQLLEELKNIGELSSSTYVVMMSAYSGEHNMESAQKMGANDFVSKPFDDIFALAKSLEEQVHGRAKA